MKDQNLYQLISDYGKEFYYKKGESLFNQGDISQDLYYINNGEISLTKDSRVFLKLSSGEIMGERTFFRIGSKSFSAIANIYSSVIKLSKTDFDKFEIKLQNKIYEELTIYLSDRIYKMNNILWFISEFNDKIINIDSQNNALFIYDFFREFIDYDNYIILKYDQDFVQILDGNMSFDENVSNFLQIKSNLEVGDFQLIGKNYVLLKSGLYYFLFYGNIVIDRYILKNTIMYSNSMLLLIGDYLEKVKKNIFMKNLGTHGI